MVAAVKLVQAGHDKLAAPKVRRLIYSVSHGRHGTTQVVAELDVAAPTGAVALVLADKSGVAHSWGAGNGTSWTVLSSGGCQTIPNGTQL